MLSHTDGTVEADGAVDAHNAPTAPWKTLRVFHELPQGLCLKSPTLRPLNIGETRIDPKNYTTASAPGGRRRFAQHLKDIQAGAPVDLPPAPIGTGKPSQGASALSHSRSRLLYQPLGRLVAARLLPPAE